MTASTRAVKPRLFKGKAPEERRRERRQRLIEAGLRVFGTRGFHDVGVREICAEAQLTERYFYESFDNREALFIAVYEHGVARIRRAIDEAVACSGPEPSGVARAAFRAFFGELRDEPRLARVVLLDVLTIGPDVVKQSALVMQGFADFIGTLAMSFIPEIERRGVDLRVISNGLLGATVYIAMQWAFGGFRESLDDITDHAVLFYEAMSAEVVRRPVKKGEAS